MKKKKPKIKRGIISQWVESVVEFSSQWSNGNWAASTICGAPKFFPHYGDNVNTWCPRTYNNAFIVVEFETAVFVKDIEIYFTLNPNPVKKISAFNGKDFVCILERKSEDIQQMREAFSIVFRPKLLKKTDFRTKRIRIDFDGSRFDYYFEVDAIRLIGRLQKDYSTQPRIRDQTKFTALQRSNLRILREGVEKDVTFLIGNFKGELAKVKEVRRLHRGILSLRCIVFRHMFSNNEKKKEFEIELDEKISINSFDAFLEWIYGGVSVKLNCVEDYIGCFRLATIYQCPEFDQFLRNDFESFVSVENVLNLLLEFEELKHNALNEICFTFISSHFSEIVKGNRKDALMKLPKDHLLRICSIFALRNDGDILKDVLKQNQGPS